MIHALMGLITFIKPLDKPRILPVREDIDIRTEPVVKVIGGLVLLAVIVFYIIFW